MSWPDELSVCMRVCAMCTGDPAGAPCVGGEGEIFGNNLILCVVGGQT